MTIRPAALDLGEMCRVYHDDATDGVWAAVVSGPDETQAMWIPSGDPSPHMMYLGPDDRQHSNDPPASLVLAEGKILAIARASLVPVDD